MKRYTRKEVKAELAKLNKAFGKTFEIDFKKEVGYLLCLPYPKDGVVTYPMGTERVNCEALCVGLKFANAILEMEKEKKSVEVKPKKKVENG